MPSAPRSAPVAKAFSRAAWPFHLTLVLLFVWTAGVAAQTSSSGTLILTWDPNSEPDLAGYKVYQSTIPGSYGAPVATIMGNNPSYEATGLEIDIPYYFVVTAFDTSGNESVPSNEVSGIPSGSSGGGAPGGTTTVPKVVGMTQTTAETTLIASLLSVGHIIEASSETAPPQQVINQAPAWGTTAAQGTAVDLVVSTGPAPANPPANPSGGDAGGGGGGCFIATAAYGSPLEREVAVLRQFRDRYLLPSRPGRILMAAYYELSPPLARLIAGHESLRSTTRHTLRPIVLWAKLALDSPAIASAALIVLFLAGFVLSVTSLRLFRMRRSKHGRHTEHEPETESV